MNDDEEAQIYKIKKYDPNCSERICNIELKNNNQILISYSENDSIYKLLNNIIKNKQFKKLYSSRNYTFNYKKVFILFELHLCLYKDIKTEYENKIDFEIKLDDLHRLGILKNYKKPFFYLSENKMPLFFYNNEIYKETYNNINENKNFYYLYKTYLPRINTLNKLLFTPEIYFFYESNKKNYNVFSKYFTNPLIGEEEKFDWFIYDNESLNFLIEMSKKPMEIKSEIKYINNKIYFIDKKEKNDVIEITNDDLKNFLINLTIEINKKDMNIKIQFDINTTAKELIEKVNNKLIKMQNNLKFNCENKILKVRGLNDYIFDLNDKIINYRYLNDCIRLNKNAEYVIIDNPLKNNNEFEENIQENNLSDKINNLLNIVKYKGNKKENKIYLQNVDEYKKKKLINQKEDNLDIFINDIESSIYENFKNKKEEKNNQNNNNFENKINYFQKNNFEFLKINKHIKRKKSVNIFNQKLYNNFNYEKYFNNKDYININKIKRPFSIILHSLTFTNEFKSLNDTNYSLQVILIKCQIYCGNIPFSKICQIKWTNRNKDINPLFNQKLYFDINFNVIPNFASLLFKIKLIKYDKNMEVLSSKTKYFTNFKLFDYNNRLKTGIHKIKMHNMHDKFFTTEDFYNYEDELNEKNTITLYFEIESFANYIFYEKDIIKNLKINDLYYEKISFYENTDIPVSDRLKIKEIINKSPFYDINNYDKEFLWNYRYYLAEKSYGIPRLLLSFDYNDPKYLMELEKIFKLANDLDIIQCIELLNGRFLLENIRKFAVKSLKKCSVLEIYDYLLQFIQGLKYEKNIDNDLAKFLIELSVNYPLTIGHDFYWMLQSELYNQSFQQKFGIYLEIFLNKIGPKLCTIFKDEKFLLFNLSNIAIYVKQSKFNELSPKNKNEIYFQALKTLSEQIIEEKKEISLPLNFKFRITSINVQKCKIMKSKKKPLYLYFKNADKYGDDIVVMFKKGDDLRMDMVTIQLFKSMKNIWFKRKLNLKMSLYKVLCTSYNTGMLEIVTNSETLANIQKTKGGIIKIFFSPNCLSNWIYENCKIPKKDIKNNFLLSCVAYCVATFVLGIGDRHNDNIMFKKNAEIFHIDFGHFLGHFKYKYGIKRERAPFVFTNEFRNLLGEEYNRFKILLWEAYSELRKNSYIIVNLLRILLCTNIPELDEKSLKYLDGTLALDKKTEKEAQNFLEEKLKESENSLSTKLNFAIHNAVN